MSFFHRPTALSVSSHSGRALRPLLPPVLTLLLAACSAPPVHEAAGSARVETAQVEQPEVGERYVLSGTVTAERSALLSSRADGLVQAVHVDAGQQVRRGQILLDLDPALAQESLARARAELARARASSREAGRLLALAVTLGAEGGIAPSQIEARQAEAALANAGVEAAEADVREQAERLQRHRLPAPFSGVISRKITEAGSWAQTGSAVLELVSTDRVRLDLRVPQERFEDFGPGAAVEVTADALGSAVLPARVQARVPVADAQDRTFLLRLVVDDPQGRLIPGSFARATLLIPPPETAVSVARDALLIRPDGGREVFVAEVQNGGLVARRRRVRVGREGGTDALITSGLRLGDMVVVRGNEGLEDGQSILVADRP
ncbi:MAG: RND family efflux transporter MFP subunit [Brevundimonas sp.]|jgi:RND family efflux transporter MFP subunit|uniref:efflux RND transporter periplasmic adaptor subunit n=1 Tax=Brevundimonas sp. TaxID=1871086 RepID=UPI0039E65947